MLENDAMLFQLLLLLLYYIFALDGCGRTRSAGNLLVLDLVVDKIVQCDHRADHRRQVDNQRLVVGLDKRGLDKVRNGHLGQQVEYVLQVVNNLMVDGQLAFDHLVHVRLDVVQT